MLRTLIVASLILTPVAVSAQMAGAPMAAPETKTTTTMQHTEKSETAPVVVKKHHHRRHHRHHAKVTTMAAPAGGMAVKSETKVDKTTTVKPM